MSGRELVSEAVLADALDLTVKLVRNYTRNGIIPFVESPDGEVGYYLDEVIIALSDLHNNTPNKDYTYHDYLLLPSVPGYRYEILHGQLVREPCPSASHEIVSTQLVSILEDYFPQIDPQGIIIPGPMAVTLDETTVVLPDIIYVSGQQRSIIKDTRVDGTPNLIVEITSPASKTIDRFRKLQIYIQAGVLHYWLVDPEGKSMHCFALRNEKYALAAMGMDNDVIQHPDFAGLTLKLGSIWS